MPVYRPPYFPTNSFDPSANDYYSKVESDDRFVHLFGDEHISGDKSFDDNVIVDGNLTVNGIVIEDLLVEDNVIELNSGEPGAGVTNINSGIQIDRGTLNDAKLIYDETNKRWYLDIGNTTLNKILYDNFPDRATFNNDLQVNELIENPKAVVFNAQTTSPIVSPTSGCCELWVDSTDSNNLQYTSGFRVQNSSIIESDSNRTSLIIKENGTTDGTEFKIESLFGFANLSLDGDDIIRIGNNSKKQCLSTNFEGVKINDEQNGTQFYLKADDGTNILYFNPELNHIDFRGILYIYSEANFYGESKLFGIS